jgi:hypothetical protein
VFGDYPDLDYVKDLRAHRPAAQYRGARVLHEDRRLPVGNPAAQQGYISTNYTFVARDMAGAGHERDRPGRGCARKDGDACG